MLSLASGVAMVKREAGMHPAMGGLVEASNRYAAWFHELDAWTQYWDIYHPETNGRYHFGNGTTEQGLLRKFLRREQRPAAFNAWVRMALALDGHAKFVEEARVPEVAAAVLEVDRLVSRLFKQHFGDASDPGVQADYINAMLCFGCDTLPPASERAEQFSSSDPRRQAAARYAMESDFVWFSCALHLEAVHAIYGVDEEHARRTLMLAGIAVGCSADFVWRGHRQSRPEYSRDCQTAYMLRNMGVEWANNFRAAREEVHALFRIREWGREA
ncbi:MAG: hypothetical protein JSR66_12820 [Proteobacteria bacterium]|nr:hypothetical protein [Pseudomonadota bacterium]